MVVVDFDSLTRSLPLSLQNGPESQMGLRHKWAQCPVSARWAFEIPWSLFFLYTVSKSFDSINLHGLSESLLLN